ncbi:MAG: dihydroxyacetone kinase family protein [Lachnospirales bacterium]
MNRDFIIKYFYELQKVMEENMDYLINLDSIVGDGDLGLTMSDGFKAAYESIKETNETDIGKILYRAGKSMANAVPSTMGTLMGSGLMHAGKALKNKNYLNEKDIISFFKYYNEGVTHRGKAKIGDKTFLDGMHPAIEAMELALSNEANITEIANTALDFATKGFNNTTTMIAKHGRAATRGKASRSLEDPGAAVAVLMMKAFKETVCS